ncbi:exosortase A [Altererythrobacter arenosus]|uniref:Exosortase A n=1 Tax=Altererythrobacter arenosus TaxID=3032592 RepID=A0ABY8FSI4_9SPHN|nr:exosortase A [Altererythrobacter sp. CAU 1644]WFL77185.1 exosortase A [Altererythrobacter sp. CAU 1644]
MQLERIPQFWREQGLAAHLPESWKLPLARLAFVTLAVIGVTAREWGEMLHQWWNIDTYNHILFVPLIVGWLVALRRPVLSKIVPTMWAPGLVLVIGGLSLWLVGRTTGINLLAHAGAVAALPAIAVTLLGARVGTALLLPLAMTGFLVPFGDEIIPPLQMITADIAIALTHWSGIPATIDGIHIDTPVGLFIVAEACSGVKFLVAMVTLGVLVCFTAFESWKRRAIFMLACIVVPILANGIRAWGTIYIAQSQGVEFAAGFDHIFYGWIFFAIVVAMVLGGAWRYFEREPEDAGLSLSEIESNVMIERLSAQQLNPAAVLAGLAAILASFLIAAIYASSRLL